MGQENEYKTFIYNHLHIIKNKTIRAAAARRTPWMVPGIDEGELNRGVNLLSNCIFF